MRWEQRELEIFGGITIKQQVQEFAAVFAVAFVVLSDVWIYYFDVNSLGLVIFMSCAGWLIVGLHKPRLVYPLWILWLAFMELLLRFLTWASLLLSWVLLISPAALVIKLFKLSKLDLSFKSGNESYWKKKSKRDNDFSLMDRGY